MNHSVSDGKLRASVRSVAGVGGVAGSCSYGVTLGASYSGLDSPSCASEGEVGPAAEAALAGVADAQDLAVVAGLRDRRRGGSLLSTAAPSSSARM